MKESSEFRFGEMMEPPPPPPPQSPGPRVLTPGEEEADEEGRDDDGTPPAGSHTEAVPASLFTYPNQSEADKEQIQQRIAQRKGREESERQRRAQERIDNMKRREEEQQQTDRGCLSLRSHLCEVCTGLKIRGPGPKGSLLY